MAVLILGAGRVSGPVFEYFHRKGISFSVVSAIQKELNSVKSSYASAQCYNLNLPKDVAQLPSLIALHKVVLHLLPADLLPLVAQSCLEARCSLVSCSYLPEGVQELHQRVVDAGIIFLCECGLDPGIDHMLAKQAIQDVKDRGGEVTSFISWCGGLPAPECSNNVLKYKFSWHPKGALKLYQRSAGYLENGKVIHVSGEDVLYKAHPIDLDAILPGVKFEGFPNKFLYQYLSAYGLQSCKNFARGTVRYEGFSNAMLALVQTDLFSDIAVPQLQPDAPDITWVVSSCCHCWSSLALCCILVAYAYYCLFLLSYTQPGKQMQRRNLVMDTLGINLRSEVSVDAMVKSTELIYNRVLCTCFNIPLK